jgi:hypothetical protein
MKYIGLPSTVGRIEAILALLSFASVLVTIVSIAAPTWVVFSSDSTSSTYSIGLWNICKDYSQCTSAWSLYSYALELTSQQNLAQWDTWYFYYNTPTLITVAQGFYIAGLLLHVFSVCLWSRGSLWSSLSILPSSMFYSVAFGCAVAFFSASGQPPTVTHWHWGYAAQCALSGLVLSWATFTAFLLDAIVRMIIFKKQIKRATEEGFDLDVVNKVDKQGNKQMVVHEVEVL